MRDKNILIGITGSIAAYKAAILIRELVKLGANVKVIMTKDACEFITPLTISTLSKHPIYQEFKKNDTGEWNNHVELALWADIMLIAPASANTIAKMANGICDNILLATYFSAKCQVMIAPAMDLDMYRHNSTCRNIEQLSKDGVIVLPSDIGELASGLHGEGRMQEPSEIVNQLSLYFKNSQRLKKFNVLVTAGPTYEAIDPVRFIGNHSSGKMGLAIARSFAKNGAQVNLICGPGVAKFSEAGIKRIDVTTAEEMRVACMSLWKRSNIAVMAAAVADYRPKITALSKIKKGDKGIGLLELEETTDILKELGKKKKAGQILVGFALETNNEMTNAAKKLREKNCDLLILNSLKEKGAGFGFDTNKVSILKKKGKAIELPLKSKVEVANDIVNEVCTLIK